MPDIELIAARPLCGDYGNISPGQVFSVDSDTAESLESRGLAWRYYPPLKKKEGKTWTQNLFGSK